MNIIKHHVQAMLANGRGSGTSPEQAAEQSKAKVLDIVSRDETNPEAVTRTLQMILKSVKEAEGWTRELFLIIRSCSDVHIAKASLMAGESRAIVKFREMIVAGDPNYAGKIKTLNDIAKYNGDKQLTYTVTKSKLFSIIDDDVDLCSKLQEWWNFAAKHDGAPHKALPDGFLNAWSKRYQDEKKGSTLFMRDAREAQAAVGILINRTAQLGREQSRDAAAHTGENGDQTQQQVTSGGTANVIQKGDLVKSTQEALNLVIRLTMDCNSNEEVTIEGTNGVLAKCAHGLQTLLDAARKALQDKVQATSSQPSQGIAAAKASQDRQPAEGDLPGSGNIEQTSGGDTEIVVEHVRPDWIDLESWQVMTGAEQARALDEGQKAWEEEAAMMEHAASLDDGQSNEPKAENG